MMTEKSNDTQLFYKNSEITHNLCSRYILYYSYINWYIYTLRYKYYPKKFHHVLRMLECLTKSWKIAYPTYRDDLVKSEKKTRQRYWTTCPGLFGSARVAITGNRENLIKSTANLFSVLFHSPIWPIFLSSAYQTTIIARCFAQGAGRLYIMSRSIVYVNSIFQLTIFVEFIILDASSHRQLQLPGEIVIQSNKNLHRAIVFDFYIWRQSSPWLLLAIACVYI